MNQFFIELLIILATGLAVLVVALLLNLLAVKMKLDTWYDFVKSNKKPDLKSFVWLFLVYPFLLGLTAYLAAKFI